jgi:trehalose/maltose hydrolase-like predicted phosphorylase
MDLHSVNAQVPSDRRYEAIVVVYEAASRWTASLGAIGAGCAAGLVIGLVSSAHDLPTDPPDNFDLGPGALLLASTSSFECVIVDRSGVWVGQRETGVEGDDDPLHWLYEQLWGRGVGPNDVLMIRGPDASGALSAQIDLRQRRVLPSVRPEQGWDMVREGFDINRLRVNAALFALADGVVGTSGAPLAAHAESHRWVLVGNTYVGTGPDTHLLTAPVAMQLPFAIADTPDLRRTLDLRSGVLHEEVSTPIGQLTSVRFSSLARPGTVVFRAHCPAPCPEGPTLLAPADDPTADEGCDGVATWMRAAGEPGGIVAAATDTLGGEVVERIAVYRADPDCLPEPAEALARLKEAAAVGFDGLLGEHRRAWAERWADADVVIEGDDELQRAVRFSLFHLMASVPDSGEAAVGARGLSGTSYRGHVFWDADTLTLPFLAATHPAAARAMLEYRLRRLPAAVALATELGREGARFPWESARSGRDVTPTSARDRTGQVVPIRTGQLEEHIVAQVAWAACWYTDWTGDDAFRRGPGLRMLLETARYWASRVRQDRDGAHIYGVIGPDEYHEPVDDNAFTNVMARWNLRRAADAVLATDSRAVSAAEMARWRKIADTLVDGYDPDTGVYEQFAGFHELEPLIIAEVAPRRPIAADLLLGAGRVSGAQVLKQADVLMLHHLVPDEVEPDSLEPNLRYYEPRTAHGSSLSPAIHASLLARSRNYEAALDALRIASRIDLDDLTGSTAGGVHLATMGGLWQALAFGFAGLRPRDGRLAVDPRLPHEWAGLELRVRYRGSRVIVRIEHESLCVTAEAPTNISVDSTPYEAGPRALEFTRRGRRWEVA